MSGLRKDGCLAYHRGTGPVHRLRQQAPDDADHVTTYRDGRRERQDVSDPYHGRNRDLAGDEDWAPRPRPSHRLSDVSDQREDDAAAGTTGTTGTP